MTTSSIPVDLFNPGQVFACLGFMEAAEILLGDTTASFSWDSSTNAQFYLQAKGNENPFAVVLDFLAKAEVQALTPPGFSEKESNPNKSKKKPAAFIAVCQEDSYPVPPPLSVAIFPTKLECQFKGETKTLLISHWGEENNFREPVKLWAGSAIGSKIAKESIDLFKNCLLEIIDDPFSFAAPQRSSFRLDWRRDYIPLDAGFSPNKHDNITMIGYPIVELAAAIGLQNARPKKIEKQKYTYSIIGEKNNVKFFPIIFLRAALGNSTMHFQKRTFHMNLGIPGKHQYCITHVTEEVTQ